MVTSTEKVPTCYKVFPLLKMLQGKWKELLENERYSPVHGALEAGLANMAKWYRKATDTSIYFISHGDNLALLIRPLLTLVLVVLDPTWKLSYVQVAWDAEDFDENMVRLRDIVGDPFTFYARLVLTSFILSSTSNIT